jgi:hypothetical protein
VVGRVEDHRPDGFLVGLRVRLHAPQVRTGWPPQGRLRRYSQRYLQQGFGHVKRPHIVNRCRAFT